MSTNQHRSADPVRVGADHTVTKRVGHWTTQREFVVRARRGKATLEPPGAASGQSTLQSRARYFAMYVF